MEPPKSKLMLRKSTKFLGQKRSVHLSKGILLPVTIRERRGPSQCVIQHSQPHERGSCAPIFADRFQEMARNVRELKEKDKATFYSPSAVWSLPAPSSTKPADKEFVVDSKASVHMLSWKDRNSAELVTVRVSRSSTTVITANGEVQTNEEVKLRGHACSLVTGKTLRRLRIFL